jgi:curved DNA-binding protein CbpA
MAQGFYEVLGIEHRATTESIHSAYHDRLAELVRRLRAARRQGADVTILESQERGLKEAMQVLSDPRRRQRYDAFRRANQVGMPDNAESLWDHAKDALVDPLAISALEVLKGTTELNIGNPFSVAPQPRKWSSRPNEAGSSQPVSAPAPQQEVVAARAPVATETSDPSNEITEQMDRSGPTHGGPNVAPAAPASVNAAPIPEPAPAPAPPVLNDVETIASQYGMDGRFLRAVRELRKVTLDELAEETRISLRYLHALESNDFTSLPAATFVRGYVKELSRALKVEDVGIVEGYLTLYNQQRG